MAKFQALLFSLFSFFLTFTSPIIVRAVEDDRKVYIVYMGSLPEVEYSTSSHQLSLLQEVAGDSATDLLLRSYTRSFNGFAAKLTDYQSQQLAAKEGVVSVFPSGNFHVQTTRSWDFMGLQEGKTRRELGRESNIIIGVIDTGIWPESESFSDEGLGPAPKKWKVDCNGGLNFTCNKKIIGARYYPAGDASGSARDDVGHGSHTASTAAGSKVKGVSFYGLGQGTAKGGVPSARIAAYKVCQLGSCSGADILAAFDDAIADGVDIITISIGRSFAFQFTSDEISIGSFHAMEKGILTVNSAGNGGPDAGSVASVAPWMLSVAASSTDRRIIDKIVLGNGKTFIGSSVNSFTPNGTNLPVVYGTNASTTCSEVHARNCDGGCLDTSFVTGKIVLCDKVAGVNEGQITGAVGAILRTTEYDNIPFVVPMPASTLSAYDHDSVKSYVLSTPNPEANILKSEVIKDSFAPIVASFSSRGPNAITYDIMKPDVTAPGVDILAAYSPLVDPSGGYIDDRRVNYTILSGTSMSCPHVAGAAAYVKSFHPHWSPSAIKSAIMTTAWPMKASDGVQGEFAYGSGHLNPLGAVHPGLVYEAFKNDYVKMLCSIGYDNERLKLLGNNTSCPKTGEKLLPKDLNYPSLTAQVSPHESFSVNFHRTVTNVGLANSTYAAKVVPNPMLYVKVVPQVLTFSSLYEKKSFHVSVTGDGVHENSTIVTTSLVWSDGKHSVRSPIILHTYAP